MREAALAEPASPQREVYARDPPSATTMFGGISALVRRHRFLFYLWFVWSGCRPVPLSGCFSRGLVVYIVLFSLIYLGRAEARITLLFFAFGSLPPVTSSQQLTTDPTTHPLAPRSGGPGWRVSRPLCTFRPWTVDRRCVALLPPLISGSVSFHRRVRPRREENAHEARDPRGLRPLRHQR